MVDRVGLGKTLRDLDEYHELRQVATASSRGLTPAEEKELGRLESVTAELEQTAATGPRWLRGKTDRERAITLQQARASQSALEERGARRIKELQELENHSLGSSELTLGGLAEVVENDPTYLPATQGELHDLIGWGAGHGGSLQRQARSLRSRLSESRSLLSRMQDRRKKLVENVNPR